MVENITADAARQPAVQSGAHAATRYGGAGVLALLVAHCAGMVDLVALPVWVGTLIGDYHLDPQQAGSLATLFLVGAVASSVFLSPRLNRLRARFVAPAGFAIAAVAFAVAAAIDRYELMAGLHVVAGLAVGSSLSVTHGTIGRSRSPHRLFAIAGLSLGCFAIAFLGITPGLIAAHGGRALFEVFAGVMAVAALVSAAAFPATYARDIGAANSESRLERAVWFGMIGVACMGLTQAMVFAFVQRIGLDRGFGFSAVTGVLIALGLVNLIPAPLAGFLESRLPGVRVVQCGALAQAVIAVTVTQSSSFAPYAASVSVFAAAMIFTHTFAFGMLARLDRTGRAVAATPAMLMTGAAIGPILGGTLVKLSGYGSLGVAAVAIAAIAIFCFSRLAPRTRIAGISE
ncbi:MFS transporter [Paraburkholderia sp. MM5384-R2]|uniref:MFS transporter n=1 Tax=Paraburkholderia sp. MM5384-R2 TaxID=2723097 RepID=UPI001609584E|nr:MFS transporter [Paraburkholderia sp. MM5384-R2]MBB5503503.1 putative MFS family arabinose efflux permease [Paraburkholderia sp. MM5384-R2]